jgi:hypothetical protein
MAKDLKARVEDLIKKYEKKIKGIINPDDSQDWSDIGFDEAPEGYDTVDEFLEGEGCELDEGGQTALQCYHEILENLQELLEPIEEELKKGGKKK